MLVTDKVYIEEFRAGEKIAAPRSGTHKGWCVSVMTAPEVICQLVGPRKPFGAFARTVLDRTIISDTRIVLSRVSLKVTAPGESDVLVFADRMGARE